MVTEFDVEFDRVLGTMVTRGMDEGLRLLSELHHAEADERRLTTLLADATKRTALARLNYERNRDLTRDIWGQLRQGIETHRALITGKGRET